MIVTSADGEPRRLNPLAIAGWKAGDVPLPGNPNQFYKGTLVALIGGAVVGVQEGEAEIDRMFEFATKDDSPYSARGPVSAAAYPPARGAKRRKPPEAT